ncbi:MAG: hypothetical protein HC892_00130 [Saprospiraceae bacterium]|nr:hypothetical protein [Saprospiraceae bacterium]
MKRSIDMTETQKLQDLLANEASARASINLTETARKEMRQRLAIKMKGIVGEEGRKSLLLELGVSSSKQLNDQMLVSLLWVANQYPQLISAVADEIKHRPSQIDFDTVVNEKFEEFVDWTEADHFVANNEADGIDDQPQQFFPPYLQNEVDKFNEVLDKLSADGSTHPEYGVLKLNERQYAIVIVIANLIINVFKQFSELPEEEYFRIYLTMKSIMIGVVLYMEGRDG